MQDPERIMTALQATMILGCEYCGWFRGLSINPNYLCEYYTLKQMDAKIREDLANPDSKFVKCTDGVYETGKAEAVEIKNKF